MNIIIVTLTAASLLVVTGCTTTQQPLSEDFGNATQQNKGVQIANPETSTEAPTYDGNHSVNAIIKYRQGLVTEPVAEETSEN